MTNKEIFDVFCKRYPQIKVADYRPFEPNQVSGKQVITIWTDKGDVILFLPNGDEPNAE